MRPWPFAPSGHSERTWSECQAASLGGRPPCQHPILDLQPPEPRGADAWVPEPSLPCPWPAPPLVSPHRTPHPDEAPGARWPTLHFHI